jgi:hypothetical protein
MTLRAAFRPSLPLLALSLATALALGGCQRAEREVARPAPAVVKQAPPLSREQAMQVLLDVPELKAWSEQIEQRSKGKARGAIIEDDPAPREVNGKKYYQLTFVENRASDIRRRESFLVAYHGQDILVEDTATDTLMSLQEWRRKIRRIDLKSAD